MVETGLESIGKKRKRYSTNLSSALLHSQCQETELHKINLSQKLQKNALTRRWPLELANLPLALSTSTYYHITERLMEHPV